MNIGFPELPSVRCLLSSVDLSNASAITEYLLAFACDSRYWLSIHVPTRSSPWTSGAVILVTSVRRSRIWDIS